MDDLARQHLEWLERQNDRAANTLNSRARVLRSIGNPGTITREDLEAWWESRAHLSTGTRAVDLSHVKGFYRWCAVFDHRTDDPSVRIRPPRVANRIPARAKAAELSALLDGDLPPDLKRAVMLGAYAGLRVSESAALSWVDVDAEENTITVRRSKGGKSRIVFVSPTLIDWLGVPTTGSVVTGGEHLPATALQQRLNRAMRAAGLTITSHGLRHRYGVTSYQVSGDLLAVSELMGHSSVNTTKVYAEASSDVKRKIAEAVMR